MNIIQQEKVQKTEDTHFFHIIHPVEKDFRLHNRSKKIHLAYIQLIHTHG